MGRKMQRVRVFLRIEAGGGGLQRHSPWKADGGGGWTEGSHQTLGRKACRKQWGVEGPSSKQGKRLIKAPPPSLKKSTSYPPCILHPHCWVWLHGLVAGEAGVGHQGEEEQPADRPAEVHEHAAHPSLQHCGHQVLLAIANRLLPGSPSQDQVFQMFTIDFNLVQLSNFRWFNWCQIIQSSSLIGVT